ncbi:hypothetical protein MRB53_017423 [Persea americana]|uniref:Uncharacterized protein n=1 Tax=Persea americana TaxID=3435 RepID=A0ACC2M542_PERAE|nr:hypothetical protein MRB53_017423 [Persea americana]
MDQADSNICNKGVFSAMGCILVRHYFLREDDNEIEYHQSGMCCHLYSIKVVFEVKIGPHVESIWEECGFQL